MAAERGFRWSSALLGALATLALILIAGVIIVAGGLYPVAASAGYPPGVRWVLDKAMHNGVTSGAENLQPPKLSRAEMLEGGSHFKGMCQQCHGGPGVKPEQFATVMDPDPPEISHAAEEWSRAEIFWIAKHGIKMTGMPAFGQYEGDGELWKIAAFVEQMPNISASEYASLPDAHAHEHSGGQVQEESQGGEQGHAAEGHSH